MDRFRRKIVIDWIRFRLTLPHSTQFQYVRRALNPVMKRDVWVKPVSPGRGGVSSVFDVTLQDPRFIRHLARELDKLWPGNSAQLIGIEVALDSFASDSTSPSPRELACELFEQFKWMEHASTGKWHLYRKGREVQCLKGSYSDGSFDLRERDVTELLADQWQLADFNKKRSTPAARFHLHVKTTDVDKRPLPPQLWRARFEVTLQGDQLPWRDVRELEHTDFAALQQWFRFRQPASDLHPAIRFAVNSKSMAAVWQPGRRGAYPAPRRPGSPRRHGRPNRFRPMAAANTSLNTAVARQLRRLHGPGDPTDFSTTCPTRFAVGL